jgi:anti-anti-sigma regulatory factor
MEAQTSWELSDILNSYSSGTEDALGTRMLRITENSADPMAVRLKLEGILSSETYVELEEILSRHNNGIKTIVLDMQGVTYLHENAARKVARMPGDRVRVVNCSPFIETLLETVARQEDA